MVKKLIIIFSSLIIISLISFAVYTRPNTLNLVLYDSYIIDTTGLRERWRMAEDSPLIFYEQFTILEGVEEHILKEHRFEINDLNISDNKYIVVTIGRSLEEIRYQRELGERTARTDIIFSSEHNENMIYVYITDRVFLSDPHTGKGRTSFFVNRGSEKIFLGRDLFEFNERKLRSVPIE